MMVQAMVVFYGIAMVYGIHLNPIPAGIVIVSINTGAYMAEIVRGGILSIDKGQFEAAHAIGHDPCSDHDQHHTAPPGYS